MPFVERIVKLSRSLEFYEGYCWFPANRALLSGLLSTPGFNKSLKLGFNKDPGAGPSHGDQSHRLQWHAIMRAMTDGFRKVIHQGARWKHSPLELFYQYNQGDGHAVNVWAKAMDLTSNPGWGNPDIVMVDVLRSSQSLLKEALIRRINKMGGPDKANPVRGVAQFSPRDKVLKNSWVKLIKNGTLSMPAEESSDSYFQKLVLKIYTWEKTRTPIFALFLHDPFENTAKMVLNDAKQEAPQLFQDDRTYEAIDTNLLVKKDAPETRVEIDGIRVANSRLGFCPEYMYSPECGATPAIPEW